MNNLEFIRQLPPEELIKYLTCKACKRAHYEEEEEKCFGDCEAEQINWLNQEH